LSPVAHFLGSAKPAVPSESRVAAGRISRLAPSRAFLVGLAPQVADCFLAGLPTPWLALSRSRRALAVHGAAKVPSAKLSSVRRRWLNLQRARLSAPWAANTSARAVSVVEKIGMKRWTPRHPAGLQGCICKLLGGFGFIWLFYLIQRKTRTKVAINFAAPAAGCGIGSSRGSWRLNARLGRWGWRWPVELVQPFLPFGSLVVPSRDFIEPDQALNGSLQARLVRGGDCVFSLAQAVVAGEQQGFGGGVLPLCQQRFA